MLHHSVAISLAERCALAYTLEFQRLRSLSRVPNSGRDCVPPTSDLLISGHSQKPGEGAENGSRGQGKQLVDR